MSVDYFRWGGFSQGLPSKNFSCGFCGSPTGSRCGYQNEANPLYKIYICPPCGFPTFFQGDRQSPGPRSGRSIKNLTKDVELIYDEIKDSISNSSYTAAILLGRKLVMHLAVDRAGSEEGKKFVQYVQFLKDSNFIPPNGDALLNYIKDLGNQKNHELKIGTQEEAQKMMKFIEALLIFMYELPAEFPEQEDGREEATDQT